MAGTLYRQNLSSDRPGKTTKTPENGGDLPVFARLGAPLERKRPSSLAFAAMGLLWVCATGFFAYAAFYAHREAEAQKMELAKVEIETAQAQLNERFEVAGQRCETSEFGEALRIMLHLADSHPKHRGQIWDRILTILRDWEQSQIKPGIGDVPFLEVLAHEGISDARTLMIRATQGRSGLPNQTRLAANEGHLPSILEMARMEEKRENWEEAVKWFARGAKMGSVEALYRYGECQLLGNGIEPNPAEAVKVLDSAAMKGEARAMDLLGFCYERGLGVPADPQLAAEWFQSAVKAGCIPAYFNLGTRYAQGDGVDRDTGIASDLFQAGAMLGNAKCMTAYARCLEVGLAGEVDAERAAFWYRKAAALGDEDSVAWCRANGIDVQVSVRS